MKFVILSALLFCVILAVSASEAEDGGFECVDGVSYQENKCNGCFCHNGGLGCTQMGCKSHDDPKLTHCEVGTTWAEGCEQCWCLKNWGTICTVNCGQKRPQN